MQAPTVGGGSTRSAVQVVSSDSPLTGPCEDGDVSYQVLGPLTVRRGGDVCSLGGFRQRLVLGVLLANANTVVSRDALIEAVWGDSQPSAAKASLHSYVSHLRDILGRDAISTRNGGYVISASRDTLDSLRFEAMIQEGRDVSELDPARAAMIFDAALTVWSGPAYGDIGDQLALINERERLSELRLLAMEDRIDLYLRLGRHADVVAELPGLIRKNPYRERFYGQLMVAQYRLGRQAEALRVFAEARRCLADDLGIDPTPQLWSLEDQILSHDPGLMADIRWADRSASGLSAANPAPPSGTAVSSTDDVFVSGLDLRQRVAQWRPRSAAMSIVVGALVMGMTGLWFLDRDTAEIAVPAIAASCLPVPDDVTAWWTGDRDAVDLIGGRGANLVHGATNGPGLVGDAFVLDGTGFVDVAHDPSLDPGTRDFTVDLWVRFDSTQGEQVVVEKWVQSFSGGTTMGWTFTKLEDNSLGFFSEGSGWALGVRSEPQIVPVDTWIHLAARRRGDTAEILVDGDLVATQSHPGGADSHIGSVSSLKFGHRGSVYDTSGSLDDRDFYLVGALDEIHFNVGRALTDAEIQDLARVPGLGYCRV